MPVQDLVEQIQANSSVKYAKESLSLSSGSPSEDKSSNGLWRVRCNFKPCPSWTEWRTGYQPGLRIQTKHVLTRKFAKEEISFNLNPATPRKTFFCFLG